MAKPLKKEKAMDMRRRGFSVSDIAKQLSVSKGSVSGWCKEIRLSEDQKNILHQKMIQAGSVGRQRGADVNAKKKRDTIEKYEDKGKKRFQELSGNELFMLGLGLYWGEGVKSHKSATGFSNSDPHSIKLMMRWFEETFNIGDERFNYRLYINAAHENRKGDILKYWSNFLSIDEEKIKLTIISNKNKKYYENKSDYIGVMLVTILQGTDIKYEILGLIQGLKSFIED